MRLHAWARGCVGEVLTGLTLLLPGGVLADPVRNTIRAVRVQEAGAVTTITLSGSARPTFTAFRMAAPSRLVVDVSGGRLAGVPEITEADTAAIAGVGATEFRDESSQVARFLINLRGDAGYRVRAVGNDVVITVTGSARPGNGAAVEEATQARRQAEERARVEADLRSRAEAEQRRLAGEAEQARAAQGRAEQAAQRERERLVGEARAAEAERDRQAAETRAAHAERDRQTAIARSEAALRAQAQAEARAARMAEQRAAAGAASDNRSQREIARQLGAAQAESRRLAQVAEREARSRATAEARALETARERDRLAADARRARQEQERLGAEARAAQVERDRLLAEARAAQVERDRLAADARAAGAERDRQAAIARSEAALRVQAESQARAAQARSRAGSGAADRAAMEEEVRSAQAEARRQSEARAAAERAARAAGQERDRLAARAASAQAEHGRLAAEARAAQAARDALARRVAEATQAQGEAALRANLLDRTAAESERARLAAERRANEEAARRARAEAERDSAATSAAERLAQAVREAEERTRRGREEAVRSQEELRRAREAAEQARSERQTLLGEIQALQRALAREQRDVAAARSGSNGSAEARAELGRLQESSRRLAAELADMRSRARASEEALRERERAVRGAQDAGARVESEARQNAALLARAAERARQAEERARAAEEGRAQAEAALARRSPERSPSPTPAASEARSAAPAALAAIRDVRFEGRGDRQEVVVDVGGEVQFDVRRGADSHVLVLRGASLPALLERTLDVEAFGGAIGTISSYRLEGGRGEIAIEAELNGRTDSAVRREGTRLVWSFDPLESQPAAPRAADASPARPVQEPPRSRASGTHSRTIARESTFAYEFPEEQTGGFLASIPMQLREDRVRRGAFRGRRIDLDFKDADIHNILRLISDVGHVNIITSDDVTGTVTIRMRNVPWDQALEVILQSKGLGMVRTGNLIRVAPLERLEKEREMAIARRKQQVELEPLETRLIPISYATASELQPRANELLSSRGSLSVDERTNVLIARDVADSLNQIEELVRNLDTQTPQVLIEARIVEATSTYLRELGIQWGGDFAAGTGTGNPTGLSFPSSIGVAGGATDINTETAGLSPVAVSVANPNFAVNLPAAVGRGTGGALGMTFGSLTNNINLNVRLSAMEETGTLRIISSPRVLTLDNREAHIEQGTLIPYSQVSAQGVQTAFQEAKLRLKVRPHVTADGSVLMKVHITRDEPDFNNTGARGDPTILKREAETELLIEDQHTAVIGGIYTRNSGQQFSQVPFFSDIPVLGWFFKNRTDTDRRSELLIFLTPRIVNRAASIGQ
ncbi:MAG: type IV pilus secretin PilQ [Deltaproteobacteria bacterium]|nr:type IV pilus secretin PilQ [Deltaproteobacteria bacterium]